MKSITMVSPASIGGSRTLPPFALLIALLMVSRIPYPHVVTQLLRGQRSFSHVVGLVFALMILLSAFILWPLAWLICTLMDRPPTNPPRWGWAAWLLVWALGALSLLFLLGIVALIVVEGFVNGNEILLLLGVPRVWGPLFALPLLAAGLTAGIVLFALLSWKGRYWSIWKRLYYSLLALAAIGLIGVFFNWGVLEV